MQIDLEPDQIVIEALVVEFSRDALDQLTSQLQNAATGELSNINTNFGSTVNNALTFTRTSGLTSTYSFTAIINLLASKDKARILSRPYLSTISGKTSSINISSDRYVVVQQAQQGASVTTTDPVSSGILMSITPFVRDDGRVRVDVDVEDSSFVPTVGNVAVEVDKKKATTSMLVDDGQSIIIGGLTSKSIAESNAGIPWLRHIPGLNLLFSSQQETMGEREVMIYITPRVWKPNLVIPLDEKDALSLKDKDNNLTGWEKIVK
ncbi:MAG: type II and III secretion system protein [Nitrospinae bacterium]|nr:type II and III secretion system protein [Nitrospinota bacterium]